MSGLKAPAADPPPWPRLAVPQLILLSASCVPAALDPDRYRRVAWMFFLPPCLLLAALDAGASAPVGSVGSSAPRVESAR
jgi:hypothetical protein